MYEQLLSTAKNLELAVLEFLLVSFCAILLAVIPVFCSACGRAGFFDRSN